MKIYGKLTKWNDDRGFGFVALPQSHEEIFVHISAFPRDGVRPRIGEMLSFEVGAGPDGRKRAERVERPGGKDSPRHSSSPRGRTRSSVGLLLVGIAILGVGFIVYRAYVTRPSADAAFSISPAVETTAQRFKCDGRTHCSQMSSCAEAEYFLKHCPGVQMDGNGDGEPCEQQWCK